MKVPFVWGGATISTRSLLRKTFFTRHDREKAVCKGECEAPRKSAERRVCLTKAHRRHNHLVYTKRQKDICEDRKHEITKRNSESRVKQLDFRDQNQKIVKNCISEVFISN